MPFSVRRGVRDRLQFLRLLVEIVADRATCDAADEGADGCASHPPASSDTAADRCSAGRADRGPLAGMAHARSTTRSADAKKMFRMQISGRSDYEP